MASLENRTPQELADRAATLKAHPKVAQFVLPELAKSIRVGQSEEEQCAAIQVARVFINHKRIEKTIFGLRGDVRERVAAAAVAALAELQPPEHAAEVLLRCLEDARSAAAADEACAGLYRLGEIGRKALEPRMADLGVGRRIWLVRYVLAKGGSEQQAWLRMLQSDSEARVRAAAGAALEQVAANDTAAAPGAANRGGADGKPTPG